MECSICFAGNKTLLNIFDETGKSKNICATLKIHFPFLKNQLKSKKVNTICESCWKTIEQFNCFFKLVKDRYSSKKSKPECQTNPKVENVVVLIKQEIENDLEEISDGIYSPFKTEEKLDSFQGKSELSLKVELDSEEKCSNKVDSDHQDDFSDVDSDWEPEKIPKSKTKPSTSKYTQDSGSSVKGKRKKKSNQKSKRKPATDHEEKQLASYYKMNCDQCEYKFKNYNDIHLHFLKVHNRRTGYLNCLECDKKQYRLSEMLNHITFHKDPDKVWFTCKYCLEGLKSRSDYRRHLRNNHHDQRPNKCSFEGCSKTFWLPYELKIHIMKCHTPEEERRFVCDLCGRRSATKDILLKHMSIHNPSRSKNQFQCNICGRILTCITNLNYHIKTHSDNDSSRVQCQICMHWLKNQYSFNKHMKNHRESTGDHVCPTCGFVSISPHALKSHIRKVHTKQRIHKCTICENKAFKTPQSLKEHMATHNPGQYLYNCEVCGKQSNSQSSMYAHRKKIHPEIWAAYLQPKYIKPQAEPLPSHILNTDAV